VDEAHRFGLLVGAHCTATDAIVNSLDAGVDMIIHGMMLEQAGSDRWQWVRNFREEVAERIAREGKTVNTTLQVRRSKVWSIQRQIDEGRDNPTIQGMGGGWQQNLESAKREHEEHLQEAHRLIESGVQLIPGMDAGMGWLPFGHFVDEVECLVLAGMTPMTAIQAATREAAKAIGVGDLTGTLKEGLAADLLVVDGDPSQDIRCLGQIEAVFLEGDKVK
jgi:imidazolonepropionase-like amidohydrolase